MLNRVLTLYDGWQKSFIIAKEKDKDILQILTKNYNLNEFSLSNWVNYQDAAQKFDGDPDTNAMYKNGGDLLSQYQQLNAFFDILRDDEIDEDLLDFVSKANSQLESGTIQQISFDSMVGHFPYTDLIVKDFQNKRKSNSKII